MVRSKGCSPFIYFYIYQQVSGIIYFFDLIPQNEIRAALLPQARTGTQNEQARLQKNYKRKTQYSKAR